MISYIESRYKSLKFEYLLATKYSDTLYTTYGVGLGGGGGGGLRSILTQWGMDQIGPDHPLEWHGGDRHLCSSRRRGPDGVSDRSRSQCPIGAHQLPWKNACSRGDCHGCNGCHLCHHLTHPCVYGRGVTDVHLCPEVLRGRATLERTWPPRMHGWQSAKDGRESPSHRGGIFRRRRLYPGVTCAQT